MRKKYRKEEVVGSAHLQSLLHPVGRESKSSLNVRAFNPASLRLGFGEDLVVVPIELAGHAPHDCSLPNLQQLKPAAKLAQLLDGLYHIILAHSFDFLAPSPVHLVRRKRLIGG